MRPWPWALAGMLVLGAPLLFAPMPARASTDGAHLQARLAAVRLPFIANQGQVDARVAYYAPTFAGTLFVTRGGELVYALGELGSHARRLRLSETLVGGRARPAARERSTSGVSAFLGSDPARWRPELPTYEEVSLGEVWPGVTVALRARGRSVEKVFTVHPGGAVERIRARLSGARALTVDADGALVAATRLGSVTFTAPVAYQERDGMRRPVAVAYRARGLEYGFSVGAYDPGLPLVIDPLLQSTYLGGFLAEAAVALAIHPTTGDVYVAGGTFSGNFPGTAGGAQPAFAGGGDAFVARLPSTLTSLTQATYLGGSGADGATAVAIHPMTGDVYVAGVTDSANFPGTAGGAQPAPGGARDAFVARLPSTLTSLTRATYLGGSSDDQANALAIHPTTGDVYVVGSASSSPFPGTAGGAQPTFGGSGDAFVARFPSTLTALTQATYLGGSGVEAGLALAIHPATGDVYVAGSTDSSPFPGTAGGAQAAIGSAFVSDGFVARLPSSLTSLTQATYLGGSNTDIALALAIHPATGDVYVGGLTFSSNFPGTAGGAQPATGGGNFDAFVARLASALTTLIQATYLGGSGDDNVSALAIHPTTGNVYVAGGTSSTNFPGTTGGAQPTIASSQDGFAARLPSSLTSLTQATYLGGSGADGASALAIHPTTGDVYVSGGTSSSDFPRTAGGAQPTLGGNADGFIARLTSSLALVDPSTAIPTLSPWALLAMVALLLLTGLLTVRRRRWSR